MISVCMATYNGAKYIKEQLDSILCQLNPDDEVIISDDGSTDETLDIVRKINDSRIKIILNLENGVISNFENAVKNSTGSIIFLCDQDDVWMTNKVSIIKKELEHFGCILHDAHIVNEDLSVTNQTLFEANKSQLGIRRNIIKNSYVGCCMAFKRDILKNILPFPKNIPMHDSWIGIISETFGSVSLINEKLIYYRRHDNNASNTGEVSNRSIFKKLIDRMALIIALNIRIIELRIKN